MSFEKGDSVRLQDRHSDHDGEVGEITQVAETMFGDETYTIQFDDGREAGLPSDALEPVDEGDDAGAEAEETAESGE